MESAVSVDGLVKRYAGRAVVDDLSFAVEAGQVLALLGPNGAGKSTTVECIAGLRTPDEGAVQIFGVDSSHQRDRAVERIGVMLQEGGVHRAASARELLELFAALYPDSTDPEELMTRLDIAGLADQRVRTLSLGQRQRVSLALALVGRPRVALLDEPTAGMDPAARRRVWDLVDGLRDDGVAVLLTTHAMEEAERLADVVAVLDAGRLLALDSPAGLTAGARGGLVLTTTASFDPDALAADLGGPVRSERPGRWLVEVDVDRMAEVTAWFAAQGLPLEGISSATRSLEDVYLHLTEPDQHR